MPYSGYNKLSRRSIHYRAGKNWVPTQVFVGIRCDIHAVLTHDSVVLRVPGVKTRSRMLAESLFIGEDADFLRR